MKLLYNLKEIIFVIPLNQFKREGDYIFSRRLLLQLVILLVILSLSFWFFYYHQGLILAYNDARSRLNVARRVFDSLQPGFAQIGSVWLPLYHFLELPLVWNDFLWHSGLAGSVISMISYILGGFYLLKLIKLLKFDLWASLFAFAVYALNPNLLFMQALPMTESLLIFLSIATVYHIVFWSKTFNVLDIVAAAFFTFLSTLTRYDGWFLLLFVTIVVGIVSLRKRGKVFAEGNIILYMTLAGFGVFLWFLWNKIIFGDVMYFALGPFSAKAQQDILLAEGRLYSKGNIVYSSFLYLLTVSYNTGFWIVILAFIGFVYFIKSGLYKNEVKLATSLLFVPLVFNIVSLFVGHSVIHLPNIPPYTWFNDRYGLMVLPAIALYSGFVVRGKRALFIMCSLILILQISSMYLGNKVITVEDGVRGASSGFLDNAGDWLGKNANDGLILVAASSNDALLFRSGLPLKKFILEGARKYWDEAIVDPTKEADWVVMHKGDLVYNSMVGNIKFLYNYRLMYKDDFTYIYEKDMTKNKILTKSELP